MHLRRPPARRLFFFLSDYSVETIYPLVTKLILLLLVLGVVAALAGLIRQWWLQREIRSGRLDKMPEIRESAAAGCCGQHATCEKDSLLAAVSHDIEYYEDEELDRFRGRNSDQYSDAEIEEFNEILTTLRSEEVAGWIRSLQLREIALPDELKDDVILLVGERRTDLPH